MVNYAVGNAGRATSATDGSGYQYAAPQGGSWPEYAAFGPLETMTNGAVSGGFAGIANYSTWANGIPRLVLYGESAVVGGNYVMNYANFPLANQNFEAVWDDIDNYRTQSYTYDYLQRITSAITMGNSTNAPSECWGQDFGSGGSAYDDRYGNLSQMTVTQCSNVGSLDQGITSSTNQFAGWDYDAAGNNTGGNGTQGYDAENRMTTAGYTGFLLTNTFDALNLKITKTRSDGLYPKMYWRDIWGNTLSESDTSGNMANDYIYFAGKRIAYVTSSGSQYYYLTDHLGSVRKITDANGNKCFDADYTPYGDAVILMNTCAAQPYLFAGMERDEDQLDYDFARFYSWRQGRFMSADPLGGNMDNPQSLNRYTYVENNPINLTDPSGMNFCIPQGFPGGHNPGVAWCDPHAYGGFGDDPEGTWASWVMSLLFPNGLDNSASSSDPANGPADFADDSSGGPGPYDPWASDLTNTDGYGMSLPIDFGMPFLNELVPLPLPAIESVALPTLFFGAPPQTTGGYGGPGPGGPKPPKKKRSFSPTTCTILDWGATGIGLSGLAAGANGTLGGPVVTTILDNLGFAATGVGPEGIVGLGIVSFVMWGVSKAGGC